MLKVVTEAVDVNAASPLAGLKKGADVTGGRNAGSRNGLVARGEELLGASARSGSQYRQRQAVREHSHRPKVR